MRRAGAVLLLFVLAACAAVERPELCDERQLPVCIPEVPVLGP